MAQFRYVGDEDRLVSILPAGELFRLQPDQLFDVGDEFWDSYACQPHLYQPQSEDPQRQGIDAVLADVGSDRDAAAQALDAERRALKPRRRLLAELEKRATAEPEPAVVEIVPVPAQPAAGEPSTDQPIPAVS